jgi:hypothetical protein
MDVIKKRSGQRTLAVQKISSESIKQDFGPFLLVGLVWYE